MNLTYNSDGDDNVHDSDDEKHDNSVWYFPA